MLTNTFIHIPNINELAEKELWDNNILTWEDLLSNPLSQIVLGDKYKPVREFIVLSQEHLLNNDISFFKRLMSPDEMWRLYKHFKDKVAYLDIETTNIIAGKGDVTVIGIYNGREVKEFVHGRNLHDFVKEVLNYELLVTFNGSKFDIPFLKHYFKDNISLDHAHIDLRFFLKRLGFRGGLKRIEKEFGIARDNEVKNLTGYDAVCLWNRYKKGDQASLDLLIKYNTEDIVNLEFLMKKGYELMVEQLLPSTNLL
ncbi:MAG: ribonuclease H-like domain-containing protein [bacterium]